MADYGMKRNGSGYYDPTAYAAMIGMAKPGEIWETNKDGKLVLILNNHGGFCNCLTLTDKSEDKNCMEVRGMYTNPGMVRYLFNDYLSCWVSTLAHDEFDDIMAGVADALGLHGGKHEPAPEPVEMTLAQKCHALLDMILEGGK